MEEKGRKVYLGRRSMSAGDDMNVPNMKSFILPDSLDEFVALLNQLLPFDSWTCYLGYPIKNIAGEEDGIIVGGRKDSSVLISTVAASDMTIFKERNAILNYAENWHDLITEHPYLFCE